MYAIVDIAGQQFKVKKDQKLFVHRLVGEVGNQVDFDRVLLIDNDSSVSVGAPVLQGAMVSAKILEHLKGDKVIVFKKRRRKGYRVKNGHRQYLTQIVIEEIVEKGAKPKPVAKTVTAKAVEPKVTEEAKPVQAEKKASEPKAAAKPVAEKKVSEPKAATKPAAVKKASEPKTAAKPAAEKKAAAAKKPAAEKATAARKPATEKASAAKKPAAKKPAAPKKADGKKK
jgi:large subunit ribosomal protein L21